MHRFYTLLAALALTTALAPATLGGPGPIADRSEPVNALQAAADASEPGTLAQAVAVTHAGTDVQLDRAGLDTITPAEIDATASPAQEALDLLETHGVHADDETREEIDSLDELDPAIAGPLADVLAAFERLTVASQASFATADIAHAPTSLGASPAAVWETLDIDASQALAARAAFLDATVELERALETSDQSLDDEVHVSGVLAIDLTTEDDVYSEDIALVIDDGGDDRYANNAGGTGAEDIDEPGFPAAAVVDLGGADTYGFPEPAPGDRRSGANGGGLMGVGMLIDDGTADDTYAAYADGVNGGAFLGVGLLMDTGGADTYDVEGWGANGGGYPGGIGQLVDLSGDDTYTGTYEAVNGGGLIGSGLLYDAAGDDVYTAEDTGTNGGAWLGQGLLLDEGGNDRYEDEDGGTGEDRTVLPKGPAGAQIDL